MITYELRVVIECRQLSYLQVHQYRIVLRVLLQDQCLGELQEFLRP